ncbi:MAG: pyridoxamine 5'-phosphate oxidase family protein [Clostridia bacterium]|nr:pyridoxamine 5'-phosphate oxidase family protein [Clostridia bacterium]
MNNIPQKAQDALNERFNHDCLISLATAANNIPYVRTVNAYYENGAFYIITYALSAKIAQIKQNPIVAISGDWFTAHGLAEDLGYVLDPKNEELIAKLRNAFSSWYSNGHTNEADENTHILCIRLNKGILFDHGTRYDLEFNG